MYIHTYMHMSALCNRGRWLFIQALLYLVHCTYEYLRMTTLILDSCRVMFGRPRTQSAVSSASSVATQLADMEAEGLT